jgi:carboxyl-terminal processing protease
MQSKRITVRLSKGFNLYFLICLLCQMARGQTTDVKITTSERAFTATQVYSLLDFRFAPAALAPGASLDASYRDYLKAVLAADDRRQFDLATIEFVAQLHNGHTFFWDAWLDKNNQPLGFYPVPLGGYWVVQTSVLTALKPGDVIRSIDNIPAEAFFQRQQRYIAASSTAAQRRNLFRLPYLFPKQFILTLDGERKVTVDREKLKIPEQKTEGRWIKPGLTAYVRIPALVRPQFEQAALEYIHQYQNAKTLVIDVRNNGGGILPRQLVWALMDRPYHTWKESTTARFALVDTDEEDTKQRLASTLPEAMRNCEYSLEDHMCSLPVTWGNEVVSANPHAYHGRVIFLVDGGCVSACEELLEPFKDSGRGTLVGETTEGSSGVPYTYDFQNGMMLSVAVKRQYFPDGSEFEGVGIKPDVEVHPSIESLKAGHDVILEEAVDLTQRVTSLRDRPTRSARDSAKH